MTDVAKIVQNRLRAQTAAQRPLEHPEADLLTAFVEMALPPTERDGVLQHLALCANCRELVALALPPSRVIAPAVELEGEPVSNALTAGTKPKSFVWPRLQWANLGWSNLRWVALAAGIAVAVLVVRPELVHFSTPASPVALQTPAPSAQNVPVASAETPVAGKTTETKKETGNARAKVPSHVAAAAAASESSPTELASTTNIVDRKSQSTNRYAPGAAAARALNAPKRLNETVEDSGAATVPVTGTSAEDSLIAQGAAPAIMKAKPAPEELASGETQKASITSGNLRSQSDPNSGAAIFRITNEPAVLATAPHITTGMISAGLLQRSLDGGQTWQDAARSDHALICYANPNRSQEVWAGGQLGTLLHSSDGGKTWSTISVSFKTVPLTADIIRIDADGAAGISLETSNHEIWSTADGGKTWIKN